MLVLSAAFASGCAAVRMAAYQHREGSLGPPRSADETAPSWSKQGGLRKEFLWTQDLPAPAERVFPLLCPVQEYDWLPAWRCEMVYSDSGVAEEGCVFTSKITSGETWLGTRYEPPNVVAYAVFSKHLLLRMQAEISDKGDGSSEIRWLRSYTALDRLGRLYLQRYDQAQFDKEMGLLLGQLEEHLQPAAAASPADAVPGGTL